MSDQPKEPQPSLITVTYRPPGYVSRYRRSFGDGFTWIEAWSENRPTWDVAVKDGAISRQDNDLHV